MAYPDGPYGTEYRDTIESFMVEECICQGGQATGRDLELRDFLGSRIVLVTIHSGTCPYSQQQALSMERDLQEPYYDEGLEILLLLSADDQGSSERQALLDFCCDYKSRYGLSFTVAIDPDAELAQQLIQQGTPFNMLLDEEMVIRYKMEGDLPEVLKGNIEGLLGEFAGDNEISGDFDMTIGSTQGSTLAKGNLEDEHVYIHWGSAWFDDVEGKVYVRLLGIITLNLIRALVLELPADTTPGTAIDFGSAGAAKATLYLIELDDSGYETGRTPIAEVIGGQTALSQFGTNDGNSVRGTFTAILQPVD
jgi:hypothetical protein